MFYTEFAQILNSGQSRSVILAGNVYDLFFSGMNYVPLIDFICMRSKNSGLIQLVYELNGPIRIIGGETCVEKLRDAWVTWKAGVDANELVLREIKKPKSKAEKLKKDFDRNMREAIGNSTLALEFMRQLTLCSKSSLKESLLIIIEAADLLLPAGNGDVASLNDRQLRRISIVQDWFGEPHFIHGGDSVCLVAESQSLIHPRISKLPQVLSVEVPSPNHNDRERFIQKYCQEQEGKPQKIRKVANSEWLAGISAGLSLHDIRQLMAAAYYVGKEITPEDVIAKVEEYVQKQLGEDVVEFKRPSHRLNDVVGFTELKVFLREELIPRFVGGGNIALSGAGVAGPIGSGKTFIFEAVAAELGLPVLVLKSIRSQWFGQTDVIFERLRRVLEALDKVVIFVDEADTQFGSVDANAHATERRLTGKIQAMMSDTRLRGKVIWLLMTARIHLLSPDIRRPGRVGDLIIPILDPAGDDRKAFINWVLEGVMESIRELVGRGSECDEVENDVLSDRATHAINEITKDYSAAAFASLRSHLKAQEFRTADADELSGLTFRDVDIVDRIIEATTDLIPPNIGDTRDYQTFQALLNCTRRSLIPKAQLDTSDLETLRESWEKRIRVLESEGIR